jgi:Family of unknown function (DUF5719)
MSDPDGRRPARLLVLSAVAVVVVGFGVWSAAVSVPALPTTPATPAAAVTVAPTGAEVSSSFCAAGTGTAAGIIDFVTNSRTRPAHGVVTTIVAGSSGSVSRQQALDVPAGRTTVLSPGTGLPAGSLASSFAFTGGGVAVNQEVANPAGWSLAPCASTVGTQWLFPSGSTASGNNLTLSLYNPTSSAALADVTFLTANGLLTPQPFQGLAVGAGQLVDEDIGSYAQSLPEVATIVSVVSGALVADELQQWSGPPAGLSIVLGATGASTHWRFGTTTPAGSTVGFEVANPSSVPVSVTFSATVPAATVEPRTLEVAASSTVVFSPSSTAGWPRQSPFAGTVRANGPVVVGRSVSAAPGSSLPGQGHSTGTSWAGTRWLVPAPWQTGAPTGGVATSIRSLSVTNPGTTPCRVTVSPLGAHPSSATVVIAPGQVVALARHTIPGYPPYLVTATSPVVVDGDLGPSTPSIVSSPTFLLTG